MKQILQALSWQDRAKMLKAGLKHITPKDLERTERLYYRAIGLSEEEIERRMNNMKIHEAKTWPEYYGLNKPFEIRRNDRDYKVGNILRQMEWIPADMGGEGKFTGKTKDCRISFVFPLSFVPQLGETLKGTDSENFVVLGLEYLHPENEMPLDPKLYHFAACMQDRINVNKRKGPWEAMILNGGQVLDQVRTHVTELEHAYKDRDFNKALGLDVLVKAADVANYAMFLADKAGALGPGEPKE